MEDIVCKVRTAHDSVGLLTGSSFYVTAKEDIGDLNFQTESPLHGYVPKENVRL